jgi:hypothetical protein
MADAQEVQLTKEQILEMWLEEYRLKRREVRREGKKKKKANLRVCAIQNNSIRKSKVMLKGIRAGILQ